MRTKGNKYRAKSVVVDGERFDSQAEYKRWEELKLLQKAGEISDLKRQLKIPLRAGHGNFSAVGPYRLAKFRQLVTQWRTETSHYSSVTLKMDHPAFKAIVEMDECAVEWIIEELRTNRDFLFMALHKITNFDPSPPSAKGKPHEIIEAWLQWAEREDINRPIKIRSGRYPNGRAVVYIADFAYAENGKQVLEDKKGMDTPLSRLKRAIVEAMYPGVQVRIT